MKKIMFSNKWGLHQAVISGEKPTTMRLIPQKTIEACKDPDNPFDYPSREKLLAAAPYKVGDIVAVAEAYKDVFSPLDWVNAVIYRDEPGWTNKMFTAPEMMRYFIEILTLDVREIQSITQEELEADGLEAFRQKLLLRSYLRRHAGPRHVVQEFFFQTMHVDIRTSDAMVYKYGFKLHKRGTCRVCGCTATNACANPTHGNCWWVDDTETLCSHCAVPEIAGDPATTHPNHRENS